MIGTIIRLLLLCLIVGLLLAYFNINPSYILTDTAGTVHAIAVLALEFFRWAKPYVMLGAVIVIPIALLLLLLRLVRR